MRPPVFDLWDTAHPAENDEEPCYYEDMEDVPMVPDIDHLPETIDYSDRAPGDFMLSGPCGAGRGPGRYFTDHKAAFNWACCVYGSGRVKRLKADEGEFRWMLLVKRA